MTSIELHQDANKLRKEKKYNEALPLYGELWNKTGDQYDDGWIVKLLEEAQTIR